MHNNQIIFSVAALICGGLLSCSGATSKMPEVTQGLTSNSNAVTSDKNTDSRNNSSALNVSTTDEAQPSTRLVEGEEKKKIFNAVVERQAELGLCIDGDDLTQNIESSSVYTSDESQYLVSVLCFNAAYQSNYEFVYVYTSQTPFDMHHSKMYLAGFPTFDPATNILSNSYKLIGAGTCLQNSNYYWDGYVLRLISSTLEDGVANGCAELGARSPSEEQLITATGAGMAKLGMTLGELRKLLPEDSKFEPTQLGVDLPLGFLVSFYGEGQFGLGFDNVDPKTFEEIPITDASKIEMIIINNPNYFTAEGVGAGTPIKEAIAQYGEATLSYNTETESREFIEFANNPFPDSDDSSVVFRSNQWTVTDYAGIYPETSDSAKQTKKYQDHAAIGAIWIMKNF